ncbi:hypothetical protein [Streptomyces eurythermus]|uniref:hypothetical protein n=1 Tax=Streptomyces eurythermus TaxID=42237 RepID=UPI0036F5FE5A
MPGTAPRRRAQDTARDPGAGRGPRPGELAVLQRTVGNAVTRRAQRQTDPGVTEEARRNAADPTAHGEWSTFRDMMAQAGFPADDTDVAWQLVLGGIAEQGRLNDEAMAKFTVRQGQRDPASDGQLMRSPRTSNWPRTPPAPSGTSAYRSSTTTSASSTTRPTPTPNAPTRT